MLILWRVGLKWWKFSGGGGGGGRGGGRVLLVVVDALLLVEVQWVGSIWRVEGGRA